LKIVLLLRNAAPGRPDAYRDGSANGSLWNTWKVAGGSVALVRPDGFVGWMERRPFPVELEVGVRKALGFGADHALTASEKGADERK
jgi:hypothetical protein